MPPDHPRSSNDGTLITVLVVVVALIVLGPLIGMFFIMPIGLFGAGHMWMPGLWWFLAILALPLILIGGLVYLVYTLRDDTPRPDPALAELRVAYARGELSDEEFERRRERLRDPRDHRRR